MKREQPKPESRSQRKRAAIIEAAANTFRDEGYDTTSMDRIAEVAGVSKRTVYNHFGSKEALLTSVFHHYLAQMRDHLQIAWDPTCPVVDQLRKFAQRKVDTVENPLWMGLTRMALGVFIHRPELAQQTTAQADQDEDSLVVWLRQAHQAGQLQVPQPERAAAQFWALIKGQLFWPAIFDPTSAPQGAEREAVIDDAIETFLRRFGV